MARIHFRSTWAAVGMLLVSAAHAEPVPLAGITQLSLGGTHSCAITTAASMKCWGGNEHGQIGDGTNVDRLTPAVVGGLSGGMRVPAGGFYHSCVAADDGAIRCWGAGTSGQLGNDMWNDQSTPVTVVELGGGASQVSTGLIHSCALLPQGHVKCWGSNGHGQLGNNDDSLSVAVPVDALEDEVIFRGGFDPA